MKRTLASIVCLMLALSLAALGAAEGLAGWWMEIGESRAADEETGYTVIGSGEDEISDGDFEGFDLEGFDLEGFDLEGFDPEAFDLEGFNLEYIDPDDWDDDWDEDLGDDELQALLEFAENSTMNICILLEYAFTYTADSVKFADDEELLEEAGYTIDGDTLTLRFDGGGIVYVLERVSGQSGLIGVWKGVETRTAQSDESSFPEDLFVDYMRYAVFSEDGSARMVLQIISLPYTVNGQTLACEPFDEEVALTYELSGDTLTLTGEHGDTYALTRVQIP